MTNRAKNGVLRKFGIMAVVSVIVGFAIFIATALSLGVPSEVLFGNLRLYDTTKISLELIVIPEAPMIIGEEITIITVDPDRNPVSDVKITVKNSNGVIVSSTQTNAIGRTTANYAGEGTIVKASKDGYHQDTEILPHALDKWARDTYISAIIAVVIGIPVGIVSQLVTKKLGVKV